MAPAAAGAGADGWADMGADLQTAAKRTSAASLKTGAGAKVLFLTEKQTRLLILLRMGKRF
jgi:hypothetical protein